MHMICLAIELREAAIPILERIARWASGLMQLRALSTYGGQVHALDHNTK
jgi:hypothetical protein